MHIKHYTITNYNIIRTNTVSYYLMNKDLKIYDIGGNIVFFSLESLLLSISNNNMKITVHNVPVQLNIIHSFESLSDLKDKFVEYMI